MLLAAAQDEARSAGSVAAGLLLDARDRAALLDDLPDACRPADIESAFEIQSQVTAQLLARGDGIAGWKCASPANGKVIAAPIYASKTRFQNTEHEVVRWDATQEIRFEPELAMILKMDLPPRAQPYLEHEILQGIGEVRLALEIIGSRYVDPAKVTFPELLADGLLNSGLVLGPKLVIDKDAIPETFELTVGDEQGKNQTYKAVHPEVNVLRPLTWFVHFLNKRGIGLHAGQALITGSYAGVLSLALQRRYKIQFGTLGAIDLCS